MGRALVLLHGFTQTGASWDGVRAALEPQRYRPVLAPDLRGHGGAGHARPAGFDAVLADIAALPAPRFTLAGYSLGGRLALLFALAHPDRVERLVLIGATAGLADPAERAARRAADEELAVALERDGIEAFAARWAAAPLWAGQPADVAARAQAMRRAQDPAGLAASLRGTGTGAMTPVWDRLGELPMPVTYAAGERDARFAALAERMAAATPGAQAVVIPGAGHAAPLEAPAAVARLLTDPTPARDPGPPAPR
jgi:2-succinyl-6-hydroxy-2,4-cyclohexadiene-1-carboxylate synthase